MWYNCQGKAEVPHICLARNFQFLGEFLFLCGSRVAKYGVKEVGVQDVCITQQHILLPPEHNR